MTVESLNNSPEFDFGSRVFGLNGTNHYAGYLVSGQLEVEPGIWENSSFLLVVPQVDTPQLEDKLNRFEQAALAGNILIERPASKCVFYLKRNDSDEIEHVEVATDIDLDANPKIVRSLLQEVQ